MITQSQKLWILCTYWLQLSYF